MADVEQLQLFGIINTIEIFNAKLLTHRNLESFV